MIRARAMPSRCGLRVALSLLIALGAGAARAEIVNRIVATVDGEPITAHELRRFAKERGAGQTPERQILEALVTDKLLEKEIKALGITARDEEIDRYVKEIQTRNALDDERFRKALAEQGLTPEAYRVRVKGEIERAQLVNREIRGRVNVSPEEVERYYEAHRDEYVLGEGVKVRHILIAVGPDADAGAVAAARAKAEEVQALLLQGRDFAEVAREHSDGPAAAKGGVLGTFKRGEMERPLDEAVFALAPGAVSEPVRTAAGFHLLRVDDVIGSGREPLDAVKDEIRERLYNQALEERFQPWMSRDLRERHQVESLE